MKGEPIDDTRLAAILDREEKAAVGFSDGELADQQEVALDFYEGRPFGDEEEGRSQFVTRDVAEVVDHMTVVVLRAFVAGDHVVEFEGHPKAKEATATLHYLFMRKQSGYWILHDWLKAGLLEKVGVVKTSVETKRRKRRDQMTVPTLALADDGAGGLVYHGEDGTASKVTGAEPAGETVSDEFGEYPSHHHISVERVTEKRVFCDDNVPSEEFLYARRTKAEDTSNYLAHRSRKTRSELVEMGFDIDVVFELPTANGPDLDSRARSRFGDEEDGVSRPGDSEPATQEVIHLEEYIRADRDGDGYAEPLRVHRVGQTILEEEELEEAADQPFVVFTPFKMQHRMVGHSLADKTMDIQRLRSVLWRQTLDNLYLTNAPRTFIHEESVGENTVDDLLTVRPNGIVRWTGAVKPEQSVTPFAAGASVQMIEMASGEKESRTGITRMNQGLDRDALNKTASGTAMMMAAGQDIEEYIARNFGECLARLFVKKAKLLREFGEPMMINIDGKETEVDPRTWPEDMDMNVQVGLGTGRKDQRIAGRQMVGAAQAAAVGGGVPIVSPKQLFNSAAGLVADANIGAVSDYFTDPESPEGQALAQQGGNKPDPEMAKVAAQQQQAQQQTQLDQAKAASAHDLAVAQSDANIQALREKNAATIEAQREKSAMDIQLAQAKASAELDLAREQQASELQLAREKMQLDYQLALETARLNARAKVAGGVDDGTGDDGEALPSYRPGGDLDK